MLVKFVTVDVILSALILPISNVQMYVLNAKFKETLARKVDYDL